MLSRFAIAVLLAATTSVVGYTQNQDSDVVIGALHDVHDGYSIKACASDGRTLLMGRFALEQNSGQSSWNPQHSHWSMLGVSRDGSTITYQLPEGLKPQSAAYDGSDLVVLTLDFQPQSYRPPDPPPVRRFHMLRFDNQANLLNQQLANIDFMPMQMVVLPSGKAIVEGTYRPAGEDEVKRVAAVVDTDGKMVKRIEFPLPPQGGGWTIQSGMSAGNGAAYLVVFSYNPSSTGIAKISEDGSFDVKIIPNPPYNDERHHNAWMVGPGVAVEVYDYADKRERSTFHFDEYDLTSGQVTAYRYAFVSGGGFGCYSKNEVSMLTRSANVDLARGLSPDESHLIFSKLQNQAVSEPVVNPNAPPCAPTADPHALQTIH
jgi:hypothetical protein